MNNAYELTFWGGISRRYKRNHSSFESAQQTALTVLAKMGNRAAHPAIIYGPGCGPNGRTIS